MFLLTSRDTFSGGEDFAYAVQSLGRATVIGEATRGGAHPTERYRLAAHFLAHIPVAQSIGAATGANWEGTGVQPNIAVPAAAALRVAKQALLKSQPNVRAGG